MVLCGNGDRLLDAQANIGRGRDELVDSRVVAEPDCLTAITRTAARASGRDTLRIGRDDRRRRGRRVIDEVESGHDITTNFGNYDGSMSRTPVGTTQQPRSDTALFAHVAWRLEGGRTDRIAEMGRTLGIAVGDNAIRKAPSTAARLEHGDGRIALRQWYLVDLQALDFFEALVELQLAQRHDSAYRGLAGVAGVTHLLRAGTERILALVIYERQSDEQALRARLGEFAKIVRWEVLEDHDETPAVGTWRALARQAAERERLITNPARQ